MNTEPRTEIKPSTIRYEEFAGTEPHPVENGAYSHLRILWLRRKALTKATVLGLIVGLLLAFLLPKKFESTARLMPPDTQSPGFANMIAALTTGGAGFGSFAGDLLGMKSSGALFMGVLRSRTVQDRLVERFALQKVYSARLVQDARKKLASNTVISEDRKSGIITITVTDRDPKRAAEMAKAYVDELDRLVARVSTSSARRERLFLEDRLKSVKADLDNASREFSQFASKNATIDIREQGRAMVEGMAILQGQLIAAEAELQGIQQIYTPNNVRVRSVRARIAALNRQLKNLSGTQREESAGEGAMDDLPSIRELPILGVPYADLYRRQKIQETVYQVLTQQYEMAKVQEAKEIPAVKVLDEPDVPEKKSSPPRLLILLLVTFFFFAFSAVWVLGNARWNEMESTHPGRMLAADIYLSAKQAASKVVRIRRSARYSRNA